MFPGLDKEDSLLGGSALIRPLETYTDGHLNGFQDPMMRRMLMPLTECLWATA